MKLVVTRATVQHELGHWIVGRSVGFPGTGLIFSTTHAGAKVDIVPSISTLDEAKSFLQRRIKMLFAGAISESLAGSTINPGQAKRLLQTSAKNDFSKISELMRTLVGITHAKVSREEFSAALANCDSALSNAAADTLIKNAKLIHHLTSFVFNKVRLAPVAKGRASSQDVEVSIEELEAAMNGQVILS